MEASVGDRLRQHSHTTDVPDRLGTVVAVLGEDGGPPYRVRFDSGDETIVTPGPDATVEPAGTSERLSEQAEQVREQVAETVGEATRAGQEAAQDAVGKAARAVSDAARSVADRLGR